MKIYKLIPTIILTILVLCSCTPIWSVKLQPIEPVSGEKGIVFDKRSSEDKEFRYVDFLKLSYKYYLADKNTTPDRISILKSRLINTNLADLKIEVSKFDILSDTSGSACKGCALAAVSSSAATIATADEKPGDDTFTCSLIASVNGVSHSSEVLVPYRVRGFEGMGSQPVKIALQECINEVIDRWITSTH